MRDKLRALIAQLRLHGVAEALDTEIERAEREAIAAPELLRCSAGSPHCDAGPTC